MNGRITFPLSALALAFASAPLTLAQQDGPVTTTVPNAMEAHTWFIILAAGAFLAWSISYSIQLHKEALIRKSGRQNLLQLKNQILDQIAELESQKEAGAITVQTYNHEFREMKQRLSRILEQLERDRAATVGR